MGTTDRPHAVPRPARREGSRSSVAALRTAQQGWTRLWVMQSRLLSRLSWTAYSGSVFGQYFADADSIRFLAHTVSQGIKLSAVAVR